MTFLNPLFLLGISLIGIPILIHILSKRRYQIIPFSAVRFLKIIEEDTIKKLRIKQWLLLLLRILFPVFIILGLSRPLLFSSRTDLSGWDKHSPVYIILDNSASMNRLSGENSLLNSGKEYLYQLFHDNQFPRLIRTFSTTEFKPLKKEWFATKSEFLQALRNIQPTFSKGNLKQTLINVRRDAYVNNSPRNLAVIISDFQDIEENDFISEISAFKEKNWRLILVSFQATGNNLSIGDISLNSGILQAEKPVTVSCVLKNYSAIERKSSVQLTVNDIRSGQSARTVPPGGSSQVEFEIIPSSPGYLKGYFSIKDEQPFDNSRYFVLKIPEHIRLLVTCPEKDFSFLNNLFSIFPENLIDYSYRSPENLYLENFSDYNVLLLANIPELDEKERTQLNNALEDGTGIIFFFGNDMQKDVYNRFWHEKMFFPLWKETYQGNPGERFFLLGEWDKNHPLFKGLWRNPIESFDSPEFFTLPMLIPDDEKTVITFSNSFPFLLESQGKTLIFSTDISGIWSDFNARGIFPPLLLRAIQYLAGKSEQSDIPFYSEIGDPVKLPATPESSSSLRLKTPDGREILIPANDNLKDQTKKYFTRPGIYNLKWDEAETFIAMNIPASEINQRTLNLQELPLNVEMTTVIEKAGTANLSVIAGYGREIWQLFYLLALITIFTELWLARESKQKNQE